MLKKKWRTTALPCFDLENAILTGEITERPKDQETGEWKYLISGQTLDDNEIIVVGKVSVTNKLVIITVYIESNGSTN